MIVRRRGENVVAAGQFDRPVQGVNDALVFIVPMDLQRGMLPRERRQHLPTVVRGAVVNDDDFERRDRLTENGLGEIAWQEFDGREDDERDDKERNEAERQPLEHRPQ